MIDRAGNICAALLIMATLCVMRANAGSIYLPAQDGDTIGEVYAIDPNPGCAFQEGCTYYMAFVNPQPGADVLEVYETGEEPIYPVAGYSAGAKLGAQIVPSEMPEPGAFGLAFCGLLAIVMKAAAVMAWRRRR